MALIRGDHALVTGFEPELPAVEMGAGQRASGKVVFDIAPGHETDGQVELVDNMFEPEPLAHWAL